MGDWRVFARLSISLLLRMIRVSLLAFLGLAVTSSSHALDTAVFTIKTMTAQMKYDTAEFTVAPGHPVKILF